MIGELQSELQTHWQKFWQQRTPQEKRALKLMFWILLAALAVQTLWSLEHSRRALKRQLPLLAEQAEQAHALRDAWRQLAAGGESQRTPRADTMRAEVARRLPELGKGIAAEWHASGELVLKGQVDFSVWLKWAAAMHEDYRLLVSHCRVTSSASGGVDLEATLSPTQGDQ